MNIKNLITPPHKSVARSIGYSLTMGNESGWNMFSAVMLLRLDDQERVALTYAALRALQPDHVEDTLDAALGGSGAGMPQAPLFTHIDQATFWADMAEAEERHAYLLASFNRMAPSRQSAFLGFVQGRVAA